MWLRTELSRAAPGFCGILKDGFDGAVPHRFIDDLRPADDLAGLYGGGVQIQIMGHDNSSDNPSDCKEVIGGNVNESVDPSLDDCLRIGPDEGHFDE